MCAWNCYLMCVFLRLGERSREEAVLPFGESTRLDSTDGRTEASFFLLRFFRWMDVNELQRKRDASCECPIQSNPLLKLIYKWIFQGVEQKFSPTWKLFFARGENKKSFEFFSGSKCQKNENYLWEVVAVNNFNRDCSRTSNYVYIRTPVCMQYVC